MIEERMERTRTYLILGWSAFGAALVDRLAAQAFIYQNILN